MQAASYTHEDPLHSDSHVIMRHIWQRVQSEPRCLALGAFLRDLLHPDVSARASTQQALEHDSFWAAA